MGETLEPPGVTGITDLPEELLVHIVSFLPWDGNQLAPLCRVSRLFQRVVEPHLYSTISLTIEYYEKAPDSGPLRDEGGGSSLPRFSHLFNTLSKYPSLRTHIRMLWLKVGHCYPTSKHVASYSPSLGLQILLLELLPSLEVLRLNPPPIFSKFPNMNSLRSLHLDFEATTFTPNVLDSDDDLKWDNQSAKYRTFSSCLIIPTLRTLKIVGLRHHTHYDIPLVAFPRFGVRSSHVNDLQIVRCGALSSDVLVDLLISIRALNRFVLECRWTLGIEYGDFLVELAESYDTLGQALEPHRVHLEELIIAGSDYFQFDRAQPIGSLEDYPALKRLAIPVHLLAGYAVTETEKALEGLPQQLEELQLQYCTRDSTDMMFEMHMLVMLRRSLAARKANLLPALKREIWWYHQLPGGSINRSYSSGDLETLVSLLQRSGGEFQMGSSAKFQSTPFGTPFSDGKFLGEWHTACQQKS